MLTPSAIAQAAPALGRMVDQLRDRAKSVSEVPDAPARPGTSDRSRKASAA